jgi:thiamine-monophosphate kinase
MDEFGLIERFVGAFEVPPSPRGPGDDAAVLGPRPAEVVTVDAVVEGVHFSRRTSSWEDVGHKALAVNLSDLAAMGARPTWFVCALGLPAGVTPGTLDRLAAGMAPLARVHGATLVGGNVTLSPGLSVTITAAGTARRPLLRSGGRAGDALYLSGHVGDAAAGLELLQASRGGVPRALRSLAAAQRRPAPHLAFGQVAARHASAAIDVSDGLLQDVGHLAQASGVCAHLASAAIPVSGALLGWAGSRAAALERALRGGEDYVLVVAVPRRRQRAFEGALEARGLRALRIGDLRPGRGIRLDGHKLSKSLGFMHF